VIRRAASILRHLALGAGITALTAAPLAADEAPPAAPLRDAPRRVDLSGLGPRGPERRHPAATELDRDQAHAEALARYSGRTIASDPRAAPISAASRAAPVEGAPIAVEGPSIGYALLGVMALCGLFVAARRHAPREIAASAFDGVGGASAAPDAAGLSAPPSRRRAHPRESPAPRGRPHAPSGSPRASRAPAPR
jgi:hypothetical protein